MHDTRHIVVDDSEYYLGVTKQRFSRYGFRRVPEFLHCPLVPAEDPEAPAWFGGLVDKLAGTKVDLVLVDGPPGALHPRSREPALEKLLPFLSDDAAVILDDANRPEEKAIVRRWRKLAPDLELSTSRHGKGFVVLYKRKPVIT
jgi:hypothetical protein